MIWNFVSVKKARQQFIQGLRFQLADVVGQPVGKFGGERIEAGGINGNARMGNAGEAGHLLGLVPDDIEIGDDALDQMPARPAALAVFEGRKVSAGDADGR